MHCMDESGICSRCGRFRRISRFPFECSRFGCGPSIQACLGNWCNCVTDTRSSERFCGSCCRILSEYIRMLSVLMRRTCYTHGICICCLSVDVQVLCMARNILGSVDVWFGAMENHNERRPCGNIAASNSEIKVESNLQSEPSTGPVPSPSDAAGLSGTRT
jgi:hypothetical protein